jgi:ubiquinone/menaquinone biosynthesis C-methylase UbiE
MARHVDALTSATLKNLREQWWDTEFSAFLQDTLRPRPGNRILDVGCGEGTAELSLGRLRISQLSLVAIDRNLERVAFTAAEGRSHNYRLKVAAADVTRLPFTSGAFDATFCVAVLQHVTDLPKAVCELARVTRAGGRVLAVEPDNAARYWYSSSTFGARAFAESTAFFTALRASRGDTADAAVGPRVSALFATCGIEPVSVHVFPVAVTHIGRQTPSLWQARRDAVRASLATTTDPHVLELGRAYLHTLAAYERDADELGANFVEIQHTILVATVGHRTDVPANGETKQVSESVLGA